MRSSPVAWRTAALGAVGALLLQLFALLFLTAPAARAAGVTVTNEVISSFVGPNNSLTGQATLLETVTFKETLTIPPGETVHDGELLLDASLVLWRSMADIRVSGPGWGPVNRPPFGSGFETSSSEVDGVRSWILKFPASYVNTSPQDQTFTLQANYEVNSNPEQTINLPGDKIGTTGRFTHTVDGEVQTQSSTAEVTIVKPDATLTTTVTDSETGAVLAPGTPVTLGQPVDVTWTVHNANEAFTSSMFQGTLVPFTRVCVLGLGWDDTLTPSGDGLFEENMSCNGWDWRFPNGGELAPGATVRASTSGNVQNQISTHSDVWDSTLPDYQVNTNTFYLTSVNEHPLSGPRIMVSKSAPEGSRVSVGQAFPWAVDVWNAGPFTGVDVQVTDTLPKNWCYVPGSAKVTGADGAVATLGDPVVAGGCGSGGQQTLDWATGLDLPASQRKGDGFTISYEAKPTAQAAVDPGVGPDAPQTNTAVGISDNQYGKRQASYSGGPSSADAFIPGADLSMVKTAGSPTAVQGGDVAYTLQVASKGPDASGPVTVTDELPAPLVARSASGDGWTCTTAGSKVTCDLAAGLAPGASAAPITVLATVPAGYAGGQLLNTATVTGDLPDPVPGNNTGTAEVTVPALPGEPDTDDGGPGVPDTDGGDPDTGGGQEQGSMPSTGALVGVPLLLGVLALLAGGLVLASARRNR